MHAVISEAMALEARHRRARHDPKSSNAHGLTGV